MKINIHCWNAKEKNVFLRIWGQIAISNLSIYTKIYQVIKKNAKNLCVKFLCDNYKTLNVVNKNIIRIFVNQILEKIHSQQVSDGYSTTFKGLIFEDIIIE